MKRLGLMLVVALLGLGAPRLASAAGWRGGGGSAHAGGGGGPVHGGWRGGGMAPGASGGARFGYRGAPHAWGGSRVIVRPLAPSRLHVWVPGYWGTRAGARVWIDGGWALPPHPGWVWVAAHWAWDGYTWVWQEGSWAAAPYPAPYAAPYAPY